MFATYVGSVPPGRQITVDYVPAGGGPQQAQRIAIVAGGSGGGGAPPQQQRPGMSTGEKLAIGAGAVALLGCYEMGCFSKSKPSSTTERPPANGLTQQR